ncbi:MAG: DUF2029 domain-containing protein [Candidatus Latescibacteria bacterium]|nr:DUF2029 domain-containing protein [Candidatus Latescibacterota bacterium]
MAARRWFTPTGLVLGAGLALHLIYLGSLHQGWLNLLFNDSSHTAQAYDFQVYYLAGKAVLAGEDPYAVQGAFGFRYLPAFAHTLARFFALLPPLAAYLGYLLVSELVLAADVWLTWKWAPPGLGRAIAVGMWLAPTPLYLELYMGQVSLWAASLLFYLFYCLDRGHRRNAGLAWTAAVLVKPNALLLLPAFLRQRQYHPLAVCTAAVVLTSLPHFLAFPASWGVFAGANLGSQQVQGAFTHAGNLGLWGAAAGLVAKAAGLSLATLSTLGDLPRWGQGVVLLGPVAVLAASLYATLRSRNPDPLLPHTLWLSAFFLVYKDVWEHHYVFLLPVLVVLYLRYPTPWLLVAFAGLALPTPLVFLDLYPGVKGSIDPERAWSLWTSLGYRSTKLIPAAGVWGWQLALLLRPVTPGTLGRKGSTSH